MTECPGCGAPVAEDDDRCGECGRRLRTLTASPAQPSAAPSSKSVVVPSPLPPLPPPPRRSRRFDDLTIEPPKVVESPPAPLETTDAEPPPAEEPAEEDAWRPPGGRTTVTSPLPPPATDAAPVGAAARATVESAPVPAPTGEAVTGDEFVWPPPWMPPEEATPLQRSKRLRIVVGATAVLLVALLGAFIASRVAGGGDDNEIKPTELQVGQCFDAPREELTSVEVKPCTEDHQHEVFAVVDHPASRNAGYPGDDQILRFAGERCIPLFERYGNVPYEQANLADFEVVPTRESWEDGERRVICAVSSLDGEMMRGSVRGQGQS